MISISELTLRRGNKLLFENANITIFPGHRVGVIGRNGAGKSSLFAMLLGTAEADKGECTLPSGWRISQVAQETPALDKSAIEYVIDGDSELRYWQKKYDEAQAKQDGKAIAQAIDKLEAVNAYTIESRAAELLNGLGFSNQMQAQSVASFSGGWRMRLNLAQALLCPSELLLLDEPTNHLDLDTIYFLEQWIKQYQGTLLIISHDRDFLDNTINQVLHIENQQLNYYKGNYTTFERTRAERLAQQQASHEKQQRSIKHMQSFVERFRYKASKAKQAQSRLKALEKMEQIAPAQVDNPFTFSFLSPSALPNPLVSMEKLTLGYDANTPILKEVKMNLSPGARIGLLGRNGAGKSTFIKTLSSAIAPLAGTYHPSVGLSIGYFAQHQLETLVAQHTPIDHLTPLAPDSTEQQLRDYLGGFGFNGDKVFESVGSFSGGEKARLVLALLVWQKPNLLLLDEPTNHLDLDMRHALIMALNQFEGAMIVVSHDRHILKACCDEYYLVHDGALSPFNGDLDDYHQWLNDQNRADKQTNQSDSNKKSEDKKQQKREQAQLRQRLSPLKKQQSKLEAQQDKLSAIMSDIEAELSDATLYNDENKGKLKEILEQQITTKNQLEECEMLWFELQEEIESIESES